MTGTSAWNVAASIAAMAGGFADSAMVPTGDTANMVATLFTVTDSFVIRLVNVNAPEYCSPVTGWVSIPSDATVWPSVEETDTVTNVPRMPIVAVGVSTRMLPVLATWAAMKLTVPCTRLITAEFEVLFGSYTNSLSTMRAFSFSVNALPSEKAIASVESVRVWTTSPWKIRSPTFNSMATPLRTALAEPVRVSTRPIGGGPAGAPACMSCAYWPGAREPARISTRLADNSAPSGEARSGAFSCRK
jgi:hypothetical protein